MTGRNHETAPAGADDDARFTALLDEALGAATPPMAPPADLADRIATHLEGAA